jgi:hypothetical protein
MAALSVSFTLGKAGAKGGANVEHNNREFIAKNVDPTRIHENITYVKQDVREAYRELFSESLAEYNARQKRSDRKIDDYFTHISEGKREEAFYEIIVQFGDSKSAGVGTAGGELAKKLLDEYMQGFRQRNPNLHIFNSVMHCDEASNHLHINIIPFYTAERTNGLSKGVSMRSALDEQGFTARNSKQNRLVAWEESEIKEMERILKHHGLTRDVKGATYAHMSVDEYKESQAEKKIVATRGWDSESALSQMRQLQHDNNLLRTEKQKLVSEKQSPYKSFFYSDSQKLSYVIERLNKLQIPFRETESGFEAQDIFVEQIRKLEKEYKSQFTSGRDVLRDSLDKIIMQSKNYDEVLQRLRNSGCEVKQGKYVAIKPRTANGFIRLKSLGCDYSEQAIKNRITQKLMFEQNNNSKITSSKNPDSLETMTYKTIRHYTIVFTAGVLPMSRRNKKKPFSWENCEELNRLADLNRRINNGMTLTSLRDNFAALEKSVADKTEQIATLKTELATFRDLYSRGERCFKFMGGDGNDLRILAENEVTDENYHRIAKVIAANEREIAELEQTLPDERSRLKDTADTLAVMERVAGATYVQGLIDDEKNRTQAEYVKNGSRRAD